MAVLLRAEVGDHSVPVDSDHDRRVVRGGGGGGGRRIWQRQDARDGAGAAPDRGHVRGRVGQRGLGMERLHSVCPIFIRTPYKERYQYSSMD